MQKSKEKKNRFAICFKFYLFLPPPLSRGCQGRRRRRRKMMRSVNREISCLVTPSSIPFSKQLSGAVREGGAGGEVCCCVPT